MLSPLFLISPIMGWSWPSLLPIAIAVASGYGYKKLTDPGETGWLRGRLTTVMENQRVVSVPIDEILGEAVSDEVARDERLVFERGEIRLIFRRDARGKFSVDVLGPKATPAMVLRQEAERFSRELVQGFVYNRVVRELEARGINVTNETVDEESGDIVLDLRRWKAPGPTTEISVR
ncbi:hypothetical protein JW916_06055 [Candidatus Sumerlaeota bacterium]|nr:hypothetical protein [Candidatus Sumerlaeota bacterium]